MNPTSTEHDFRFPRRPMGARSGPVKAEKDGSPPSSDTKTSGRVLRANLQDHTLTTYPQSHDDALHSIVFPTFHNGIFGSDMSTQSPEQLQKEDPLATQVWRFYVKTKQMLPNQERMENLTWRMMHLNLRKRRQEERQAR